MNSFIFTLTFFTVNLWSLLPYKYLSCKLLFFIFLFTFSNRDFGQTYVFAQLTGSPMNTSGWNLQGAARVTNVTGTGNSELLLCPVNQTSGAAFFKQPINLSMCNKWKAEFDFRLYDGTGADGLAFCFLDVPPSGFVIGEGLGIPKTANGLKVCFDTWNNCIPYNPSTVHNDMPKVEIRWGNGYNECSGQPTRTNADGKISFIRSVNYNHAEIIYDNGNIQVFVDSILMITANQQFNFSGYLGFTASTAGYTDNQSIKNVKVYTEMPPSFAGKNAAICPADTVAIGGDKNTGYSYTWFPAEGLSDTTSSSPLVHLTNDSSISQIHTFYVKTAFSSNPGCASMDSVEVKVYPNPKVNFINPEICLQDAMANFNDSSYTGDESTLPFSYSWSFGDPNANYANPNNSFLQNPSHHYSGAANYSVNLKVTSSKGCVDSLTKIFTVNGAIPKSQFQITSANELCSNQHVQLANLSSVDFGSITKIKFLWGDTSAIETDETPSGGKMYDHHFPSALVSADSSFTIRMIAYSGISCMDTSSQTVNILRAPKIKLQSFEPVCNNIAPFSIAPYASVSDAGTFGYSGTAVNASGMFHPNFADSSNEIIYYTFKANNNCVDSASQQMAIVRAPGVDAGPDLHLVKGESGTIKATASGENLQFDWYPAIYLNDNTLLQPTVTPLDDMNYILTVTAIGGCKDSSEVAVKILPEPRIPNAFTPNNDGLNDSWGIPYLKYYEQCDVKIFNRFGQLVYHSTGYQKPWDGTYKGEALPGGTYVYVIDTKKQKKLYKGIVTLIR
ncbi:MAG TPA: gliding motility-associated C-terminal domain-containing protein [Hanamia sp.]|nr:gliding motility-associated C-terminal domain-containing protein [Hanamia sp.]